MQKLWLIIYYGFAQHLPKSTRPLGKFAKWLRLLCARHLFAECKGDDINLEQGAYIGNGSNFHVLGNAGIGRNFACHSRIVTIHGNLMMGEEVLFQGGGHRFDNPDLPLNEQGGLPDTPLEICEDVWIGTRVIILPGCKRIGAHSIIGAGAVVTNPIPGHCTAVGVPAKVLKIKE